MHLSPVDPVSVPEATGGYVNALEVAGASRLLFVSGQIPQTGDGHVPVGIEDQCRLVWANPSLTVIIIGILDPAWLSGDDFVTEQTHSRAPI